MSVLIKGMNKPDMCGHCKFATAFDCMASGAFIKDHHKINDDCPIVYIPPHGRLIDADAFEQYECHNCDGCCEDLDCDCINCDSDRRCQFMLDIHEAPTIIPAEPPKEET